MRKFGIELEVSGISKEQAAEALSAAGIEAVAENYNHRTRSYWKLTTDSSIQTENGSACEAVSPPLPYRESSFVTIAKVCAALTEAGAVVNASCGMHVHVDCRGISDPDFYRLLLTFYSKYEGEIDMFVHENRRNNDNTYCRTNKSLYDSWDRIWSSYADVAPAYLTDIFSGVERYYKLNFASYVRHGTVEFRQFQGTLDAKQIRAWVDFCVNLVENTQSLVEDDSKKRGLRTHQNQNYQAPQAVNYFHEVAKAFPSVLSHFVIEGANNEAVSTDPYVAMEAFERINLNGEKHPLIQGLNLDFTPVELNNIFKILFQIIYISSTNAVQQNLAARRGNSESSPLRDLGFVWDKSVYILATAAFFGFHGTKEQVTRQVNAKLTNLGLMVDRRITIDENFYPLYEWLLDRNSVARIDSNPYYNMLWNIQSDYKCHRFEMVGTFISDYIQWTRRFHVQNPRNLRIVTTNEFSRRQTNMATEIVSLILRSKYMLQYWNIEGNITYNLEPRLNSSERNTLDGIVRLNRRLNQEVGRQVSQQVIYSRINNEGSFEAINKQPYFDLVDSIRTNEAIAAAFAGLADTEKVIAVRNDTSIDDVLRDTVNRVRTAINQRNNARTNSAATNRRAVINIQENIDNLLVALDQYQIESRHMVVIQETLTGTRSYNAETVEEAMRALETARTQQPVSTVQAPIAI